VATAAEELARGVRAAEPRSLARALTVVEDGGREAAALLAALHGNRDARVVGITGPPGAGKSSLVERLGAELARRGAGVAVLAVDPSSPFSGGAILGDRVRMTDLAALPDCFVRSMATRGALGGLAAAAADAVDVFEAAGFPVILLETVGVGQDEVDVMHVADTVVLALPPGLGDDVQAAKAGVMEIADVFAVTKADLPGAEQVEAHIRAALALAPPAGWAPPVVQVSAPSDRGFDRLADAIEAHGKHLGGAGLREAKRRERARRRVLRAVEDLAGRRTADELAEQLADAVDGLLAGRTDPYSAARVLLSQLTG